MTTALEVVTRDILDTRDQFNSVLTDPRLSFDREAGFAIQILQANDYALGIAMDNRQSVVDAVTNVAAIGISLNPAKRQAYLVPRDKKICLDISYMGLVDIAVDAGSILWAQAMAVHKSDTFKPTGVATAPIHEYRPFDERGPIIGFYCTAKTVSGDFLTTIMSVDDVNDIRDRSSAWKAWVSKKRSCPWVTDYAEMGKKTVIKRAWKGWPRAMSSERLEKAIHYLNTEGGEGLYDVEARSPQPAADPLPPPQPPAETFYPQADFDKNYPTWAKLVQDGRKTPNGLIATLSSNINLSEAQRAKLRSIPTTKGERQ